MIKLNEYFNGNIKSLGARIEGQEFTAGIVLPGNSSPKSTIRGQPHLTQSLMIGG